MLDVDAIEDARPEIRVTPGRWDAQPYPGGLFLELLGHAIAWLGGPARFCDAGAGCGGQVLRAAARGCDAWGVEIEPAWAQAGRDAGADVRCMLAEDAPLAGTRIVYLNQLYQHRDDQAQLEARIRDRMDGGAVLISANYAAPPPAGWTVVWADPARWRGVWVKP
jgi:SAM-dependent methyltransferase